MTDTMLCTDIISISLWFLLSVNAVVKHGWSVKWRNFSNVIIVMANMFSIGTYFHWVRSSYTSSKFLIASKLLIVENLGCNYFSILMDIHRKICRLKLFCLQFSYGIKSIFSSFSVTYIFDDIYLFVTNSSNRINSIFLHQLSSFSHVKTIVNFS